MTWRLHIENFSGRNRLLGICVLMLWRYCAWRSLEVELLSFQYIEYFTPMIHKPTCWLDVPKSLRVGLHCAPMKSCIPEMIWKCNMQCSLLAHTISIHFTPAAPACSHILRCQMRPAHYAFMHYWALSKLDTPLWIGGHENSRSRLACFDWIVEACCCHFSGSFCESWVLAPFMSSCHLRSTWSG